MTNKEIVLAYLSLSESEKKEALKEIKRHNKQARTLYILKHVEVMKSVCGIDVTKKIHNRKYVDAKAIVSYVLRNKGFNHTEIGETLDNDRTNIRHLISDLEFYVEHNFSDPRIELLEKYKKALKQYNIPEQFVKE